MNELISGFVGKDCIVYISASSGTSINGVITSLNENWITVRASGIDEVINLDYVIRVKEYPVGKNGKRKKIVFCFGIWFIRAAAFAADPFVEKRLQIVFFLTLLQDVV